MNDLPLTRKTELTVYTLKKQSAQPLIFKSTNVACIVQTSVCECVPYLPKKLGTLPALHGQIL